MIVCITAQGSSLDSEVDPRFGRCSYFIFYDTDTKQHEAVENQWKAAMGGAGIQAAQFVVQKGAKKVFTGRIGPNAEEVLKNAGVEIVEVSGKVKDIISKL
ncbi:NifB/NifX family molybdenum-iron cluster-binding protein [Thermodesulfobacterium hydrogeniphilum]|uniref:NifB/NifX family molybdenum-iron cluster-binding protein n=1 Tax=Thermodesulfobacterium hydrogeniphilum TaxID=161156 RepID=UPI0005708EBD|nr:NifB/NifX family molybdenum-iron cluster-binding protein [Thermodesulfobacterium hydrogeniphilum]